MNATHAVRFEVVDSVPAEVPAGVDISVRIRASCAHGCDLRGATVDLIGVDDTTVATALLRADETSESGAGATLATTAPRHLGSFVWQVVVRRFGGEDEEDGGETDVVHEASPMIPLPFETVPHLTTMAVWDVRTPVIVDTPVSVKVGVRCGAGCHLAGRVVDVVDATGVKVGEGIIGDTPLGGTDALYWAALDLTSPAVEGVSQYVAALAPSDSELPHEAASARFSFRTTRAPEYAVTIMVVDRDTGAGVSDVEVRLGLYIRTTDASGRVHVEVPGGDYDLTIRKDGFGAAPMMVEVTHDTTVQVDGMTGPTMAEIAPRLSSFQGFPWG